MPRWLGVDVGRDLLHLAVLDGDGRVELDVVAPDRLAAWLAAGPVADAVAVDAPAAWADDAHRTDERVAPKFRRRCAEAVLARRDPPHFVSWASCAEHETDDPAHGWMAVGVAVHATLRAAGATTHECWPHASWQRLADARRLPPKSSADGRSLRRRLLAGCGVRTDDVLADAGHDGLDAAVAALTAALADEPELRRGRCEDRSHPQRLLGVVLPPVGGTDLRRSRAAR